MAYVKIFHIVSLFYKAQYRTVHMSFFHILSGYNSWLEYISAILESKTGNHFSSTAVLSQEGFLEGGRLLILNSWIQC